MLPAKSKGKGFAGTIKRYGKHRGPMSHGSKHKRKTGLSALLVLTMSLKVI